MSDQESFISHLVELRQRLVRAVGAVLAIFVVLFLYPGSGTIYDVLALPLMNALPEGSKMIATGVITPFMVPVKVTALVGFMIALPYVLYQAWAFVAPGLYEHEKRYTRSFVFFGSFFFAAGAAFCYFVVIHFGLGFLLHRYEAIHIQPLLQIGDYLSLVSRLVLAFGIMFELPVLAFFLARVGIIDHRFLIKHSRYGVIAIALLAAVLTPPDLISQVLLMAPLMLLYAASIAAAYAARYRMNRLERDAE